MKRSIFDPEVKAYVLNRLSQLQETTKPEWGMLQPNQLMKHLQLALQVGPGEIRIAESSTFLTRTVLRYFMLNAMVPPKKRLEKNPPQTFAELDVVKSKIPVSDFNTEKAGFVKKLDEITEVKDFIPRHPKIGKMSRTDWGHQIYAHINYHFTQFGV